jgi:uncharacterized LabA/DUF88 family protein
MLTSTKNNLIANPAIESQTVGSSRQLIRHNTEKLSKPHHLDMPPQQKSGFRGRVAIFVDASNLFYAASAIGIQIEHSKLLDYIVGDSVLAGAYFYSSVDSAKRSEREFLSHRHQDGYQVIDKELVRRSDGSKKANLDIEIALDMVIKALEKSYDTAVLISGDGDFTYAVNTVKSYGKRVEVVGLYSMTSHTLIQAADYYTNLGTIKNRIRKPQLPPRAVHRLPDDFLQGKNFR